MEENTAINAAEGSVYLELLTPSLNKNDTLAEYEHERKTGDYIINCAKVIYTKAMTSKEYDIFANNLLMDYTWLAGKGGAGSDATGISDAEFFQQLPLAEQKDWLENSFVEVVEVSAPGRETIYINPEGYNYARYVLFSLKTSKPILEKREKLEQEIEKAENEAYKINDAMIAKQRDENRRRGVELLKKCRPAGAKAAIISRNIIGQRYTDYCDSKVETKEIIIGWSKNTRDLFPEMRKSAKNSGLPELAHLGPNKDIFTCLIVSATQYSERGEIYPKGTLRYGQKSHKFTTMAEAKNWLDMQETPRKLSVDTDILIDFEWIIKEESIEHRENYTQGGGYFLKSNARHESGWEIFKAKYYNDDRLADIISKKGCYCVG